MRWRKARVRVLLATRNEYVPSPGSSTRTESGALGSAFVPCPDCKGTGEGIYEGRVTRRPCLVCNGAGRRRRVGDEQPYDFYTEAAIVKPKDDALRVMTPAELDASLARLDALFAEREGQVDHERFGWERARQQRDRSGSYRKLDRLLEELRLRDSRLVRAISMVYDHGLVDCPNVAEELAVTWLAQQMPRGIGVPDWALEQEDAEVERAVLELAGDGISTRELAERVGVSRHRVDRIVQRVKAARAA